MPVYIPIFKQIRELIRKNPHAIKRDVPTWYFGKVQELINKQTPNKVLKSDPNLLAGDVFIGKFCMFFYDPKWKQELPYYDKFPLILPIDINEKGFLGLNFHYLPVDYRIALLDKLLEFQNNNRFDVTTRLKVTYEFLKGVSKFREIQPCIKQYLANHVRSQFVVIQSYDWHIACLLPVERFQKESKEKVWEDSLAKISRSRDKISRKKKSK